MTLGFDIEDAIREMESGTHAVLIYDSLRHKRDVLLQHLSAGAGTEGLVYAYSGEEPSTAVEEMRQRGMDVDRLMKAGELTVTPASEIYLKGGTMDIGGIIRGFADLAYGYQRKGKKGVRAGADMTPVLNAERGPLLTNYEERLGRKFSFPGKGICAYDLVSLYNTGYLEHLMPIFMAHSMVIMAGPTGFAIRQPDEVERGGLPGVFRQVAPSARLGPGVGGL